MTGCPPPCAATDPVSERRSHMMVPQTMGICHGGHRARRANEREEKIFSVISLYAVMEKGLFTNWSTMHSGAKTAEEIRAAQIRERRHAAVS